MPNGKYATIIGCIMIIKQSIQKVNIYLKQFSTFKFIITMFFFCNFIPMLIISLLSLLGDGSEVNVFELSNDSSIIEMLFWGVVIVPIVETLFFQLFVIIVLQGIDFFIKKSYLIIVISGMLFGFYHVGYDLSTQISIAFVGMVLAYSFILYDEKKKHPFLVVTSIHALQNLVAITLHSLIN